MLLKPPSRSEHQYSMFVEKGNSDGQNNSDNLTFVDQYSGILFNNYIETLSKTPDTFRLLFPSHYGWPEYAIDQEINFWNNSFPNSMPTRQAFLPFFYQDNSKTFIVTPQFSSNHSNKLKDLRLKYKFQTFYHPQNGEFIKQLNQDGIEGLLNPENSNYLLRRQLLSGNHRYFDETNPVNTFADNYGPSDTVAKPYPSEIIDFFPLWGINPTGGAYSLYNWELFFHAPLLIADRLMKNQRFEDAQKWFHYIFDPTVGEDPVADSTKFKAVQDLFEQWLGNIGFSDSHETGTRRYWKIQPFFLNYFDKISITWLMKILAGKVDDPVSILLKSSLKGQIDEWRKDPFKPHLIARMRITPYQMTVVMKYISNLIAWGDQLFRRDTMESINEGTQLYILASRILGPRPTQIQPRKSVPVRTYNNLEPSLDYFSNAIVELENSLSIARTNSAYPMPLNLPKKSASPRNNPSKWSTMGASLSTSLYFCIPHNEELLGYWDTISDRLFKIRHCMNIEGIERELALFEPPINPALLVKAAAAGLDIGNILQDLYTPLPRYRFQVMLQKALEICNEVKALGGALLSALEKNDAEELALLRSDHEIKVLEAIRITKEKQIEEANEGVAGLEKSRKVVETRRNFYRDIKYSNEGEKAHLGLMAIAAIVQAAGQEMELAASGVYNAPDVYAGGLAGPFGGILEFQKIGGGSSLGLSLSSFGKYLNIYASLLNTSASMSATIGGYDRRWNDWKLQESIANKELDHIDRQIAGAKIRQEITEQELKNHDLQIENATTVNSYMHDKFTNKELYSWMTGQTSGLFFQSYQLAYDIAKRVERCYRFELGLEASNFIQFGYWDSLKKGLLAGEKLNHDLKRMEMSYFEQNKREYEITKHISVSLHDPVSLIFLRETGKCEVNLREVLFDMDYPGHFMRRIKSISVSIPCITGPHTSVSCTLTLLKSGIRKNTKPGSQYAHNQDENGLFAEDDRFIENFGAIQSIATSHCQNDNGLFELNFRDERYLPFEGAGAISQWRIELPKEYRQFDYGSISDVILHLKYTAREGGQIMKTKALEKLDEFVKATEEQSKKQGLYRAINLKQDFSNEWHRFISTNDEVGNHDLKLSNLKERFPYYAQNNGKEIIILRATLIANIAITPKIGSKSSGNIFADAFGFVGNKIETIGQNLRVYNSNETQLPISDWTIRVPGNVRDLSEMWLILQHKLGNANP